MLTHFQNSAPPLGYWRAGSALPEERAISIWTTFMECDQSFLRLHPHPEYTFFTCSAVLTITHLRTLPVCRDPRCMVPPRPRIPSSQQPCFPLSHDNQSASTILETGTRIPPIRISPYPPSLSIKFSTRVCSQEPQWSPPGIGRRINEREHWNKTFGCLKGWTE